MLAGKRRGKQAERKAKAAIGIDSYDGMRG
jgi:hypothetical protein